ncbi:MAG: PLP-dependent aminotransferase family protein [Propionibacteriaceae bacterium]|nr:PLP-dependent aminotransferase family protein [Propionibacteriaceae bacterium]
MPEPRRDTRLDRYLDLYAQRTKGLKASAVRSLFAVANRPEVVSLAGGMPNIGGLPLDMVADAAGDLIRQRGPEVLQYGGAQGEPRLREQICQVMALEGVQAEPDDVVVSCGSQQALDLITRTFIEPGDVVLAEAPSYVGALNTFQSYQAQVVHVAMDQDGLQPEALRQAALGCRAAGRRVKFCYTIPNFNNPTGLTQSLERRRQILEVAAEVDLLLIEDNPYGLLTLDHEPWPALRAFDHERVVYLGSFSKTFAPGLRVGWAVAPHPIKDKLVLAQEAATLCPPVFSQHVVSAYLSEWDWRGQVDRFRQEYRARRAAMLQGLEDHMPEGTTWTKPGGGFFVWVTLPEGLDSQSLLATAVTNRVAYVPGTGFYADGLGSRNMRLSYCFPPPQQIYEGTRRLGEVLAEAIDLAQTFGLMAAPGQPERSDRSDQPDQSDQTEISVQPDRPAQPVHPEQLERFTHPAAPAPSDGAEPASPTGPTPGAPPEPTPLSIRSE